MQKNHKKAEMRTGHSGDSGGCEPDAAVERTVVQWLVVCLKLRVLPCVHPLSSPRFVGFWEPLKASQPCKQNMHIRCTTYTSRCRFCALLDLSCAYTFDHPFKWILWLQWFPFFLLLFKNDDCTPIFSVLLKFSRPHRDLVGNCCLLGCIDWINCKRVVKECVSDCIFSRKSPSALCLHFVLQRYREPSSRAKRQTHPKPNTNNWLSTWSRVLPNTLQHVLFWNVSEGVFFDLRFSSLPRNVYMNANLEVGEDWKQTNKQKKTGTNIN